MPRIGLVLGGGGVVGQAYQAGVLAALERDLGWDPRTADLVVGTSAGSVTGTLLRLGVAADDLAAYNVGAPLLGDDVPLLDWLSRQREAPPPFDLREMARLWRFPTPALLQRIARRPWAFRWSVAAMTMLPAGRVALRDRADVLDEVLPGHWLDGLWLCVARRNDGGRVVLGRTGAPRASIPQAVAASCAIPGYFAPVELDGVEYFDGGVHSPTNADVLRDDRLDLAIVISPMSSGSPTTSADGPMRYAAHRRLAREVARLRSGGTEVVWFEPGAETLRAMGLNLMADDRSDRVVRAAFLESGGTMLEPSVRRRLDAIRQRERVQSDLAA